ncbi:MAG: site-specific DNA-methyltransferase [Candidatus Magnetominusculus sp. LBB02]|nr:site-specific DNA-methyltransferase [Candidatus Magnetominusculus sp. LBB02]
MPTLDFKGKQYIYSHHHSVPFRELEINEEKSLPAKGKKPSKDDNLIIHGDNLHALKALMPQYAGKIKCIYIDPPYNTGNEGWCYNDNVNSPLMREWLKKNANPVDKEDMERHDKWLCMMYPRLKLLHELLADDGVILISIGDDEVHHLQSICDEIYGDENYVGTFVWEGGLKNDSKFISKSQDYILCFAKQFMSVKESVGRWRKKKSGLQDIYKIAEKLREAHGTDYAAMSQALNDWYSSLDKKHPAWSHRHYDRMDENGVYFAGDISWPGGGGPKYEVINPLTKRPAKTPKRGWVFSNIERMQEIIAENRVDFPTTDDNTPTLKRYLNETEGQVLASVIYKDRRAALKSLREIMGNDVFENPKDMDIIADIIAVVSGEDAIVLDSFAGSGTTAHAVLDLNKEDGGNRRFILVEMEDYADSITAERVRRVINGIPTARDEKLKSGLGGSFTFCELGKEISIEKILTGESLPDYGSLAKYVFYTATGKSLDKEVKEKLDYFVGETDLYEVYLIYKPDIAFLRGNDSALNDIKLKAIAARHSKKEKLVFATAKYMGQRELSTQNITFCQLPYAIHKVVGA